MATQHLATIDQATTHAEDGLCGAYQHKIRPGTTARECPKCQRINTIMKRLVAIGSATVARRNLWEVYTFGRNMATMNVITPVAARNLRAAIEADQTLKLVRSQTHPNFSDGRMFIVDLAEGK